MIIGPPPKFHGLRDILHRAARSDQTVRGTYLMVIGSQKPAAALVCGCQRVDGRGGKALPSAGITTRRPAVGVGNRPAVRRVGLSRDPDPPCRRCPPRPGPDACAPFDA